MLRLFKRLKEKWGIESNFQFILINLVFAISGSSILYLRPLLFRLLGISPEWPFLLKAILYLLIVTPVYFVVLMFTATVLGQFRFFWNFERRMFARRRTRLNTKKENDNTMSEVRWD
ncbi:DUF6787 family protein [Bacteroidota bacterium]